MSPEHDAYAEDEQILAQLKDPVDIEAFGNLMEHAHQLGMSAADFIREEPERTSRKAIRKLCFQDRKRSLKSIFSSIAKNLWERPAHDAETAYIHSLYSPQTRRQSPDKNGQPLKK